MTLSIVILNYKTKGLLKQAVRGVLSAKLPFESELIVVDNHSQDSSVDMMRQTFPQVTLITSNRNRGHSGGVNLGLARTKGEFVLIMNTDVALFTQAVEELIVYLRQHPRVGLVAPRLLNPDGSVQWSCYRFSSIVPVLRRLPLGALPMIRRLLRRYVMADWDHLDSRPVGWVLGACMLLRRDAVDQVGYFDERFFLYFEDVDLCRRLWQAGWEVHYDAQAEMIHYHRRLSAAHAGLGGVLSYPTRVHIRSWWQYLKKYRSAPPPPHRV